MKSVEQPQLVTSTIPLYGRHLIEASAGTGKTHNITRIYLRLLLEKQSLSVQNILLMTFTKAATEELRGRIEKELRHALANWGSLREEDEFFAELEKSISKSEAEKILKPALLELDEAAIFTIHGFCSRVLSTQAFASGMPLDISMEVDSSELQFNAIADWIRQISFDKEQMLRLYEISAHTPEKFYQKFRALLNQTTKIVIPSESQLQQEFIEHYKERKSAILVNLEQQQQNIFSQLVDNRKKQNEVDSRRAEWQQLIAWLSEETLDNFPKDAANFINGNRYRGNEELKTIFQPLKELKDNVKEALTALEKQINKIPTYQLVSQGIKIIDVKFKQAKKTAAILDFNDLIVILSERLSEADGKSLIDILRKQYPIALVDEFQDTDPHQYNILDKLYPNCNKDFALYMIGDPKQAIYSFRGGDIFTYLNAREQADFRWHMDTNWRSTEAVINAYNRLFWGAPLNQDASDIFKFKIDYEQIKATPKAAACKKPLIESINSTAERAALNYVWLPEIENPSGKKGDAIKADWLYGLANWCSSEVKLLLNNQNLLGEQALVEKDIAILVRGATEAIVIKNALSQSGYSSVYLSDKENIYASKQAAELLLVLQGILDYENQRLLTAALSTHLLGGDATKLASYLNSEEQTLNDEDVLVTSLWDQEKETISKYQHLWFEKGCMALLMALIGERFLPPPEEHERALTNMIHLAELLQQAASKYPQPRQLVNWFKARCTLQDGNDESVLRLESDANLIQIITQHGSKGLEYPIVFIPFASNYSAHQQNADIASYHDKNFNLVLQLGNSEKAKAQTVLEDQAEAVRLLYVAITRASHRCYIGVAPIDNSHLSALGLSLKLNNNDEWQEKLRHLVEDNKPNSCLIEVSSETPLAKTQAKTQLTTDFTTAQLKRKLDHFWAIHSFSSLVRKHQFQNKRVEREDDIDEEKRNPSLNQTSLELRFAIKKGTDSGNLLHDVLEQIDFSAPKQHLISALFTSVYPKLEEQSGLFCDWVTDCLQTPLPEISPNENNFCLADLTWQQTLREVEFYFPIEKVSMKKLAECLTLHRNLNQDKMNALPHIGKLEGMMRGYIDLIFEFEGKYYLADYKSTHLGNEMSDYDMANLKANNERHFYDLQYLIYSVALHRYLKVRIDDYCFEQHFGGVYYFYLRGMSPENEQAYGVFSTAIKSDLITKLEQAFNRELTP